MPESLSRRIASHRAKLGLTQQELAERVGVSRVTVSHLEAGMTVPGERTVALLAGVFGVEPGEFVADTDYPRAKSDRLPVVVARYTEVQFQLGVMDSELVFLADLPIRHVRDRVTFWRRRLSELGSGYVDHRERALLTDGLKRLDAWAAMFTLDGGLL